MFLMMSFSGLLMLVSDMRGLLRFIRRFLGTSQLEVKLSMIDEKIDLLRELSLPSSGVVEVGALVDSSMGEVRRFVSRSYIRGSGIEIGAFTSPLDVPSDVRVSYVDKYDLDAIDSAHSVAGLSLADFGVCVSSIIRPDIIDDGETLSKIGDLSQDFVIANHVLEHFEDPIKGFKNMLRVVKHGGVVYLALPDMRRSFDRVRSETSFEHILRDYVEGPSTSRGEAYAEFADIFVSHGMDKGLFDKRHGEERRQFIVSQAQALEAAGFSIHFHAWTLDGMQDMFLKMKRMFGLNFDTKLVLQNGDEVIFVFEKNTDRPGVSG
ncbi:MAG: methyltransferase domain-containing protein [Pseudomonadota bacterium]